MRKILILLFIIFSCTLLRAQNTTNSPTSMFGIGELAFGEGGQYAGMGGVGLAMRSGTFVNYSNPAGITALDSARFILDMGVRAGVRIYNQSGANSNSFVGNLNNLSIGVRMKPYLYGSIFLTPVSSCGYAVTLNEPVAGSSSTTTSLFEGSGGLSKAGLSLAALLLKNLSIGASASYVTGTVNQTETQSTATAQIESRKQAFSLDLGAQYIYRINKKSLLTVGAVYGFSQKLYQHNTLTVTSSSGGTSIDKDAFFKAQYLPQYFGFGGSYTRGRWLFTGDYRFYDWSKMVSEKSYISYKNQNCIMLGAQHIVGDLYRHPVKLLMGAGLSNSYVVVSNKTAKDYYVSAGCNFTFRGVAGSSGTLSFGFKYNDQFNRASNMQRDRGISAFLNISFSERVTHIKIQ